MNLLASTLREVDVAILDFLNDLTGMFLGLLRGVGVGDVGLEVYQETRIGQSKAIRVPCGHR